MNCKIINNFEGEINNVKVTNENIYYSSTWILEQIENKFGEIYTNEFIRDLVSTIDRMNMKYEEFSFSELESSFRDCIEQADKFNHIQFSYYGNSWKIEDFNEKIKDNIYDKNNKFFESYNRYSKNEFGVEYTKEELKDNVLGIAFTDGLGDNEDYSIQVEYDLKNEREIITVWNDKVKEVKTNKISIEDYANELSEREFDDFINQENTGIYYDDLDEKIDHLKFEKLNKNKSKWNTKNNEELVR